MCSTGSPFSWRFYDTPTPLLAGLPLEEGKYLCQHGHRPLLPLHLRPCCFGLREPVRHVHRRVHRDGGRQLGQSLLLLAGLAIQRPEATVAVRLEWAHAKFLGQGEGLAVVGYGGVALGGIALCRNVTEEAQGIRLVPPLLVLASERQRVLGKGMRLLQATTQHLRLPQEATTEPLSAFHFCCNGSFHRLREQRHGV